MKPVRVALIGVGFVSSAHARGWRTHKDAEIVAVCDKRIEYARMRRFDFGARKAYATLDEVLADDEVNALDILTPPARHAPMAIRAAEAGRHVLVEKPVCLSAAEGEAMADAARRKGVVVAAAETYVFLTSHRKARSLIEDGAIGRPMLVRQRFGGWPALRSPPEPPAPTGEAKEQWRNDRVRSGGGEFPDFYDHAVHFFATARYLALDAPIERVTAWSADYTPSPEAQRRGRDSRPYKEIPLAQWTYAGGAAHGVYTRAERRTHGFDPRSGLTTAIHGSEGMIEVLGEAGGGLMWDGKPAHLVLHRRGRDSEAMRFDDEGPDPFWHSEINYYGAAHARQVHDFIDSIVSGRRAFHDIEEGTMDVRCTLAAIASAREGRPMRLDELPKEYTAF
ncbi:MAG: Gfo/Idh/MocA family oxidoreductase [Candidatus Sumerlaeota bacterium]|nr:Gfo/Idh/MocA family oxidoreductase [Candidatus Sumerlaeota bacterium]